MSEEGSMNSLRRIPVAESRAFIDGVWRESAKTATIAHPADGKPVSVVHQSSVEDAHDAVEAASKSFESWRGVPAHERSRFLEEMAVAMSDRAEDFAAQMTAETGKLIKEARTEVARSLSTMRISAEEAKRISGEIVPMDAVVPGTGKLGLTLRVPVGPVAAVTPFNAPLNTVCHKLGPALAAGNTLILKPHPHGAGIAVLLAEIAVEVGLPPGVFNVVHGGPDVGRAITTAKAVRFVNFTGSGAVAEQILREVGLKRTLLELGGNAPTIVHHDADLSAAVTQCAEAAFGLTGQSCISTQRLLVHSSVMDEFTQGLVEAARARTPGDPWDEKTTLGPLLDEQSAVRVQSWIDEAVEAGAELLCGGARRGNFLEATVLAGVRPDMKVACEEIFGPVATITPYTDIDEAIAVANDTPWGLKAGVFTASLDVALKAAQGLEYGTVNVNGASRSRVDHEPSGGVKLSGWGKEGPRYAILEMTDERMVSIAMASR
jgi:acyl-CoA reductase-like NAD-dependent aldehyde dehydrogenase